MLRGKVNKIGFEKVKLLKNKKPDVNALSFVVKALKILKNSKRKSFKVSIQTTPN